MDVQWVAHHGLIAAGHDLDPDEVLAAAAAALAAHTDLKPLARREVLPLSTLPVEAWWSDRSGGFVQEHAADDARPVTVVNLPGGVAADAALRAAAAGVQVHLAHVPKETS